MDAEKSTFRRHFLCRNDFLLQARREQKAQGAAIMHKQVIAEGVAQKKISQLEDDSHLASEKAKADAKFYRAKRETEANQLLLMP
ncbi:unnamed protein product [Cylicocyclus nassatus]|uniref:Uncharacterized protein n=1 Tax=Cylicocyclus nassatus TaxID=53992 RepID=A0AA36GRN4_CYLNA|nr:unnamed protein product [Cylicocyclus nassatus]